MIESIFEYEERNNNEGYGVALVDPEGVIITPYIDPSDYPSLEVKTGLVPNGVGVGKYEGYSLILHSGGLEWEYDNNLNHFTGLPNGPDSSK